MEMTIDVFKEEVEEALVAYDKYIVCLDKTPEEFRASVQSLLAKAITAYQNREPHLRHGIALDRFVTIILSQTENHRPICGIYFNLHSPHHKRWAEQKAKKNAP